MHEVTAIKSMMVIIKQKAEENNLSKVTKVNVVLGKFSGVTKEDFTYWFKELSKDSPAYGAAISFTEPMTPDIYLESIEG
jgi:Zn finger protein HypA/HybF involved in hydrogenase expression